MRGGWPFRNGAPVQPLCRPVAGIYDRGEPAEFPIPYRARHLSAVRLLRRLARRNPEHRRARGRRHAVRERVLPVPDVRAGAHLPDDRLPGRHRAALQHRRHRLLCRPAPPAALDPHAPGTAARRRLPHDEPAQGAARVRGGSAELERAALVRDHRRGAGLVSGRLRLPRTGAALPFPRQPQPDGSALSPAAGRRAGLHLPVQALARRPGRTRSGDR